MIGCGEWAQTVIKEIEKSKYFHLQSIVCNSKKIPPSKNLTILSNIEDIFKSGLNDCIYVASSPNINLKVIEINKKYKIPIILEKPISNSYANSQKIKNICIENQLLILPNLTNYFSDCFKYLEKFVNNNFNKIEKIIIYDGKFGPFRKNIHPIWDWGFHSISILINLFGFENFSKIEMKELRNSSLNGRGIVSKFNIFIKSKIKIKVVTGNLFKKKIRKIKFFMQNKNVLIYDMSLHEIYLNNKVVFRNDQDTLQSLLNNFYYLIKNRNTNLSQNLIKSSCQTINILERYYRC